MLGEHLKGNVRFLESVNSWEEAIRESAAPLLENGSITSKYVDDMIQNVNTNGPYIVVVPEFAMPHAKNENSVEKTGISFLQLQEPVMFPDDKEVKVLFALAAEDSTGHLDLISDLSGVLMEDEARDELKQAKSEKEIIDLINSVE
ncbi:PTS sugar transporter subunit IIA [Pontibacillus yanchengensis]|uniref:Ascorbate-specific PTS system EIIA component n=2 Tax=Pontibacillus yanchengensis TaxID=462910 RepID=A0A0A2TFZ0_9BACI|nr:PTS sugar transporter subunit IIA [Pontibacillus yanchengensis]KGP74464.1 PTS sugar transporter subunit IIA [Pontibacillus yanchengensis Y32]MYL35805.1 PTS sugar transporter subunit IIA [Pontibacillus yanchengensis]